VNTFAYLAEPRGRQLFVPRKRSSQLFGRNYPLNEEDYQKSSQYLIASGSTSAFSHSSLLYQKTIGPTLSGNPYDLPSAMKA
jgi:hypothetical protein